MTCYKFLFSFARPALNLLLSFNGISNIGMFLYINNLMYFILCRETAKITIPMLQYTLLQVACHSHI